MIKKLFKGALCAALSLSMALGSVMVGASDGEELKEKVLSTDAVNSEISSKIPSLDMKVGKFPIAKSAKAGKATARSVQNATAYLIYNASTLNKVYNDLKNITGNWIYDETTTDEKTTMTVNITLPKAGYLYVAYVGTDAAMENLQNTSVSLYQGNTEVGYYQYGTDGTLKSKKALAKGTYKLVVKAKAGTTGNAIVYPYYMTTENIGMATSSKLIVGNGNNIVQTFSIKKRSQVWIDADYALNGYIQKKSGSKWTTVSNTNYFYNSKGLERAYYALSAGSYRFVMKPSAGEFVEFRYGAKAYTAKYATKKSKAKKISRKKSKTNVLTASDAKKKTHYYKIKVTSKRKTQINVTTYQTGGKFKVTIYGKGLRTITRNLTYSQGRKFVSSGKLRKGTYYIKITKMTKNTSGRYTIKYVK